MIVVALKGMFMQFQDLPKAWKESRLNAVVWMSAFLSTVILDIEFGLGVGLLLSILNLIWKSNKPVVSVLGVYPRSNIYVDMNCPTVSTSYCINV
jgi:MFS superfamily sulfate permease-like transporter